MHIIHMEARKAKSIFNWELNVYCGLILLRRQSVGSN